MYKLTTLFLCLGLSMMILAADIEPETQSDWYLSPLGSYIKSDQSRNTEDSGINFKLGLGKEMSENFNLELGLNGNWLDRTQDPYLKQIGLELDALYFFNRENVFSPYITTGLGVLDTSANADTNPTWSAGLGLLTDIEFLKQAKLRTEVRFQQEYDSSNYVHDDILLRAGVQIPFGATTAQVAKPRPQDSDGDGIDNTNDKCPATPAEAKVNSYGCELDSDTDGVVDSKDACPNTASGTPVNARGCKLNQDADVDGVNDSDDQCPDTPQATAVNAYGCALDGDDDNDGVSNSKDQCPDSAADVRIDFKGCEIKDVISLPGIRFETNSSTLTTGSLAVLDSAADTLNKYTEINAVVAGHSDSTGSDTYNLQLSDQRAAAVRTYLISKGVSASRLSSQGFGETQPIADNNTTAGRTANRRVDLNVLK